MHFCPQGRWCRLANGEFVHYKSSSCGVVAPNQGDRPQWPRVARLTPSAVSLPRTLMLSGPSWPLRRSSSHRKPVCCNSLDRCAKTYMLYSSTIVTKSTSTDRVCVALNPIRAQATTVPYYLPVLISVRSWNVFRPVTDSALDCGAVTVVHAGRVVLQGLGREDARR